jgi:MFS family permease
MSVPGPRLPGNVLAVGFIIMTEEFAPELRGRAVGLFQSAAAVGAIFPSLLLPLMAAIILNGGDYIFWVPCL